MRPLLGELRQCSSQKDGGPGCLAKVFPSTVGMVLLCREDSMWYQRQKLIHGPLRCGNKSYKGTRDKDRQLDKGLGGGVWAAAPTFRNPTLWVRTCCPPAKLITSSPSQGI